MWPQILILILWAISLGGNIYKHGEERSDNKYNAWASLLAIIIYSIILYFGGFWNPLFN